MANVRTFAGSSSFVIARQSKFMKWSALLLVFAFATFATAQTGEQKHIQAVRVQSPPKVDGDISDPIWMTAPIATDFTELEPDNGAPPAAGMETEVRILYDDNAVYFSFKNYDTNPDSVLRELGPRDSRNKNTDYVAVFINPYADGQNDINFVLSASGVQADSRTTIYGDDFAWNAVWESAVEMTEYGWSAEMKIPYYTLRIPETDVLWGLNMARYVRRTRRLYTWNYIDASFGTFEQQNGRITAIKNIQTPVRLSFMPYVSGYLNNYDGASSTDYNAGLDLKYGINNAFTLDMTLVPDFGQARFDNQVLNLSPFEVRFQENRQFFTEGTELFSKGDFFYSRRVGGVPYDFGEVGRIADSTGERIISNPAQARVINATKVSGRNKQNLGIGVFNGITINTWATLEDSLGNQRDVLTNPTSNYNMLVLDQLYGDNNYVTLINTNVLRQGSEYHDANVTGLMVRHQTNDSEVIFEGDVRSSQLFYDDSISVGFSTNLNIMRGRGNWRWRLGHEMLTDDYDINDLGFLTNNNILNHWVGMEYRTFESTDWYNNLYGNFSISNGLLQNPVSFRFLWLESSGRLTFKNFFTIGGNLEGNIGNFHDYFEAREPGRMLVRPGRTWLSGWMSTDYRNPFALDVRLGRTWHRGFGSDDYFMRISPRVRVNNHLSFIYGFENTWNVNDVGWVNEESDGDIIMGKRDRTTMVNQLTADYVFDENTSINLIFRHYWSTADYNEYGVLQEDGSIFWLDDYNENYDVNFNAWNIDLTFTWWFAPGSQLTFLYRQAILSANDDPELAFGDNLQDLFSRPQQNNLSLRLIYWLDYNTLVHSRKK